jgi:hypothetical protein
MRRTRWNRAGAVLTMGGMAMALVAAPGSPVAAGRVPRAPRAR